VPRVLIDRQKPIAMPQRMWLRSSCAPIPRAWAALIQKRGRRDPEASARHTALGETSAPARAWAELTSGACGAWQPHCFWGSGFSRV
jgi:hypothetical protein